MKRLWRRLTQTKELRAWDDMLKNLNFGEIAWKGYQEAERERREKTVSNADS